MAVVELDALDGMLTVPESVSTVSSSVLVHVKTHVSAAGIPPGP